MQTQTFILSSEDPLYLFLMTMTFIRWPDSWLNWETGSDRLINGKQTVKRRRRAAVWNSTNNVRVNMCRQMWFDDSLNSLLRSKHTHTGWQNTCLFHVVMVLLLLLLQVSKNSVPIVWRRRRAQPDTCRWRPCWSIETGHTPNVSWSEWQCDACGDVELVLNGSLEWTKKNKHVNNYYEWYN